MSDPRLDEWLALCRVHEDVVVKSAGVYFDHGLPVPDHMTVVFDRLTWSGLVSVAAGDPVWSVRRLSLTDTGRARYAMLCEQRHQVVLPVPPAEFGARTPGRTPAPPGAFGDRPDFGVSTRGRHCG